MTNSTIIIHNYNLFSLKTTRIIFFILGIGMILLSVSDLLLNEKAILPTNLFWGVFLILTAQFALAEKSRFSPKIKITDHFVLLKNGFWSGSKKITWDTIKQIEFGSYTLIFQLQNECYSFKYNADAQVSIEIKKALREAGKEKNIPVIGG